MDSSGDSPFPTPRQFQAGLLDDLHQAAGHVLAEDLLDLSGTIRVTPRGTRWGTC